MRNLYLVILIAHNLLQNFLFVLLHLQPLEQLFVEILDPCFVHVLCRLHGAYSRTLLHKGSINIWNTCKKLCFLR